MKNIPKCVCVCVQSVSNHLQSEQLFRVYSRLMVKGEQRKGEAGSQDTGLPFSQCGGPVWPWTPLRGEGPQQREWGDGKTAIRGEKLFHVYSLHSIPAGLIQSYSVLNSKSVSLKCHVIVFSILTLES